MASPFDLETSIQRAQERLGTKENTRRKRSDAGAFRMQPAARRELRRLISGDDFPGVETILGQLRGACAERRERCPSRATIYKFMAREPGRSYPISSLPAVVQSALYNLEAAEALVPGAQLAFYCFNYGELAAIQFAAALPWLALHQASRMRGWRPRSRGLLSAVLLARRIPGG